MLRPARHHRDAARWLPRGRNGPLPADAGTRLFDYRRWPSLPRRAAHAERLAYTGFANALVIAQGLAAAPSAGAIATVGSTTGSVYFDPERARR